jgi:pimeloyl-ACP methyl ester carboxylesterase
MSVLRIMEFVSTTNKRIWISRKEMVTEALAKGLALPIAHWLSTSLVNEDESNPSNLVWGMNIDNIFKMFSSYKTYSVWPILDSPPPNTSIHLIRAGLSPRWTPPVLHRLELSRLLSGLRTVSHLIPNSGHWVNVDAPDELLRIMLENLPSKT